MNSNLGKQKFFIIYQITNLINGKIYIGAHVTFDINDKYMGSSKYLKKDMKELGQQNFKKNILYIFDNKKDMMYKESEIVNRKFCHRQDTYNKMIGGISELAWTDMVSVKDKEGKTSKVYLDDPRYLSGELVGVTKGTHDIRRSEANKNKVNVKDKENNIFWVDKNDPRYLSSELVSWLKDLPQHPGRSWEGKSHKDSTKNKMSEKAKQRTGDKNSSFGTCWVTKEKESKKIKKEDLDVYLHEGWNKGRNFF